MAAPTTTGARTLAVVTGASGGIGADLARVFARHGHDLALVARNRARLEALADEIAAMSRPRPLVVALNLAAVNSGDELASALAAAGATPDILVNNAGFGLAGHAADLDRRQQVEIVDLNIRALTDLTLRFLPAIIAARGRILNVASVAGFLPGPGMAIYYASKAYVVSFSAALSQEMRRHGVTVTALCPGFTVTDFQARAGIDAKLAQAMPSMTAMQVAEAGYAGLMAGRRRVTPGLFNKFAVGALPLMPNALILPLVGRVQDKRRHD
jgi:uncharacterized protein